MAINVTDRQGVVHEIALENGRKLMEVIRDAGLPVKAECGGCCVCATCHVYVDDKWFSKLNDAGNEETEMLDEACEPNASSRLSCQIILDESLDGLSVTLAPEFE